MTDGDALEVIDSCQPEVGHPVEFAVYPVATRPGEVEEEGDSVGSTDEREFVDGEVLAEVDGVVRRDQMLHEVVVGEASLQRAVGEDKALFGFERR